MLMVALPYLYTTEVSLSLSEGKEKIFFGEGVQVSGEEAYCRTWRRLSHAQCMHDALPQ